MRGCVIATPFFFACTEKNSPAKRQYTAAWVKHKRFADSLQGKAHNVVMADIKIGIIGDYDITFPPHPQTNAALEHTAAALGIKISGHWLPTDQTHTYDSFDGLWCAPGSPYKSLEGALAGIRFSRESGKPMFGTCGGFQHIVLEYARNVLDIEDAAHAEYDPYASHLFVQPLRCSIKGTTMSVQIEPDSIAARSYGSLVVEESYYCNFGLNPAYEEQLQSAGMVVTGRDIHHEARILELPSHPFFLGTLFVPQARSRERSPHPLVRAFVERSLK